MDGRAQTDEDILTYDVSDDTLERAASAERPAFTWVAAAWPLAVRAQQREHWLSVFGCPLSAKSRRCQ
jgi:hypothetical protein